MGDLLLKADDLLARIARAEADIAGVEAQAEAEMAAVKAKYEAQLNRFRDIFQALDGELIKVMKSNHAVIFDGSDQVDLKNGLLLYGEEDKVQIPKTALAKLEALKWEDGIKRTAAVDREAVEKWPDERLVQIGASKKLKRTWSYEIKD
jgi:hypothetical protein